MDWPRITFYLSLIVVIFIIFTFLSLWSAIRPTKFISDKTPATFGWEYSDVILKTKDNIKLAAWFVPASKIKTSSTIILLHGYPMDKGNLLAVSSFLHDNFNLLFFDFRYFGKSEGKFTTFGYYERLDLLAAIDHLKARGIDRIGVLGFSLGGAVALLTLENTSDIRAVVSDSAYANINLLAKKYFSNLPILSYLLQAASKFLAKFAFNIDINKLSTEKAITTTKIPVFIIHSKQDELVTIEHGHRIQQVLSNNPKAKFWFVEKSAHGFIPAEYRATYQKRVLKFFKSHLYNR